MTCAYCGKARAVNTDHIVSKNDRRRYGIANDDVTYHAPACITCNLSKADSRLVPASHGHLVAVLNELMAGTRWRVWDGGTIGVGR